MECKSSLSIKPRLIIHGGAGNILPSNLPPSQYRAFHHALLTILSQTHRLLHTGANALDTATYAVTLLENNPLFNAGKGAVFTRDGHNELEASVMVSRGNKKRGVGVMGLRKVKNPIRLAREMLIRGEEDLEGGNGEHRGPLADSFAPVKKGHGAQGHSQLFGEGAESCAREWGVEMVEDQRYFFTQNRWDEHVKGLEREKTGHGSGLSTWDAEEYVSQGTTGAVVLDRHGVIAVATSTGGMTNKLPGRIGDTPTLGAGFWAEEWEKTYSPVLRSGTSVASPLLVLSDTLKGVLADCLPSLSTYRLLRSDPRPRLEQGDKIIRSTAISGTGNGDSFLRINAVRTVSAIMKYRDSTQTSLASALKEVVGPGGELEKSAGNRWKKTGEGEGGMIGIELLVVKHRDGGVKESRGEVEAEHNCGGMFRAWVNDAGKAVFRVWNPKEHDFTDYPEEGKEYDPQDWLPEKSSMP